jgi:hypothetical protein
LLLVIIRSLILLIILLLVIILLMLVSIVIILGICIVIVVIIILLNLLILVKLLLRLLILLLHFLFLHFIWLSKLELLRIYKFHLLLNQPFSIFSILIGRLLLRTDATLKAVECIWLPVWVRFNFLFFHARHTFIRGHDHNRDLGFGHCFLRSADNMMLQTELEHVLNFEKTTRKGRARALRESLLGHWHFDALFLSLVNKDG